MAEKISIVEKRRKAIINTTYFVLLLAAYYLFVKFAFWLVAPFIFAMLIAMALQKPVRTVSQKTHIKKGIVSTIAVLLILALLAGILVFAGYRIGTELSGFAKYIMLKIQDAPSLIKSIEDWLLDTIRFLPDGAQLSAKNAISSTVDQILSALVSEETVLEQQVSAGAPSGLPFDISILAAPLGGLWSTAKQIPAMLLATLIGIIACFFMTSDYDNLTSLVKRNISAEREAAIVRTKRLMIDSMGKMIRSYLIIIAITFAEISLGLNFLKLIGIYSGGYILAISIITAVLDILPVLGTGTVFIPWSIYSLATGKIGLGIGLIAIYAIISVMRQIIEPRLVAMNLGLPPVLTLMGMYLGLQLFGVLGIFLVPLTFVLVKILNSEGLIQLWTPREKAKVVPAKKIDLKK